MFSLIKPLFKMQRILILNQSKVVKTSPLLLTSYCFQSTTAAITNETSKLVETTVGKMEEVNKKKKEKKSIELRPWNKVYFPSQVK